MSLCDIVEHKFFFLQGVLFITFPKLSYLKTSDTFADGQKGSAQRDLLETLAAAQAKRVPFEIVCIAFCWVQFLILCRFADNACGRDPEPARGLRLRLHHRCSDLLQIA
jgi:hypothetical protein